MIIDMTEEEIEFILEEMGISHAIARMRGKDFSRHENFLNKMADILKDKDKFEIFLKVFENVENDN